MANVWEDTTSCAQADGQHGIDLVLVHHYVGIARDGAHRILDTAQRMEMCAHIGMMQHSVAIHSLKEKN